MRYLFTRGKRYVSPHGLLEAMLEFQRELVELLDAIGAATGDDRWDEVFEKISNSRLALLAPSKAIERLRAAAREEAHVQAMIREIGRHPKIVETIRKLRKPMARVREVRLIAAKTKRRP